MSETTNIPIPLKYRPLKFSELIGQDLMSKTIQNAIEMNRIANAYLLTGVRGVGKTTTARIIAKSLNCLNITCLLYTSPSPRDKRQSRMPSSA